MRVLVDTHVFFWWITDDPKLSAAARNTIADDENEIFVSVATAWELATKIRIGRWDDAAEIVADLEAILRANGFGQLPIRLEHALAARLLPGRHRDPFDRMLAAQAQVEVMPLVTADPAFGTLSARVLW